MGRFLRLLKWAAHSELRTVKPKHGTCGFSSYHRRLAVEPLEQCAMLSITLADLPVAVQQAISSAIGWDQTAKLTASDAAASDNLGASVSISGNTLVVGSPNATVGANAEQGAAYVFTGSGSAWSQIAKLTASDGAAYDRFGDAISIDGNTIVVGPGYASSSGGAAYVFTKPGSAWVSMTETVKLTSGFEGSFGVSVSVSGDTVAVGAPTPSASGQPLCTRSPPQDGRM